MIEKLSSRLGEIEDMLATVRYLGDAVFMAARSIGDTDQCNAIQSVCDEVNNRLLLVRDRMEEIREELK